MKQCESLNFYGYFFDPKLAGVVDLSVNAGGLSVSIYYVALVILSSIFNQTTGIKYTSNYAITDLSSWNLSMWVRSAG